MGMYTELHFNARLAKDTPAEVIEALQHMVGEGKEPATLPDHPLFAKSRWSYMLNCDSAYFDAQTHSTVHWDSLSSRHFLCVRCNFKHYNDEIPAFLDFIRPYLDVDDGDFLGFYRYEESQKPTLIWANRVEPEHPDLLEEGKR